MAAIELIRVAAGKQSTLAHLYIGGRFACYILEDAIRAFKLPGQSAIPAGTYPLGLNAVAGMNAWYRTRYPGMHRGMVEVRNIPDFSLVFFHIGNYHTDTAGCLLTGAYWQMLNGDYRVLHSAAAYRHVYPLLVEQIDCGAGRLTVTDLPAAVTGVTKSEHRKEET